MKEKVSSKNKIKGISTKAFTIPLLLIVIIMHAIIISLTADVHHSSNRLSDLMKKSGEYQIEATEILASNTLFSETSNTFLNMPVVGTNQVNVGPLMSYLNEYNSERKTSVILAKFRQYDVSDEVLSYIQAAADKSEEMIAVQIHAISVMASVYPLPEILEPISNVELTAEELAMTNEERVEYARNLIFDRDYSQARFYVLQNIENCNKTLQAEFAQASEKSHDHVITLRIVLWCAIGVIIIVLAGALVGFYNLIIKPLRKCSSAISENKNIENVSGLREINQLSNAFNGLWEYRNKLESILRSEAENDALTGLPNRYCMDHDMLKIDNTSKPITILLFDINFLKQTNDTKGHMAGDILIKTAANCITECFDTKNKNNCYRIGGDEFLAIMLGNSEEDIKKRIAKFNDALVREKISVSVGYAHAKNTDIKELKYLMSEADKKMYEQKKRIHELQDLKKK